jgi:hypothetical protein
VGWDWAYTVKTILRKIVSLNQVIKTIIILEEITKQSRLEEYHSPKMLH